MNTQTKPTLSPVDSIIDKIAVAIGEWNEAQEKTIGATVTTHLNKYREQVLLKLLGFKPDYFVGAWELDHCNGRSGNSAAGDFFRAAQAEHIKTWLSQVELPKMTEKLKTSLSKQLQKDYEGLLRNAVYAEAKRIAGKDMQELLESALKPTQVDLYLKVQELINPSSKN